MTTAFENATTRYKAAVEKLPPQHMAQMLRLLGNRPFDKTSPEYQAFGDFLKTPAATELVAAYRDFVHATSLAA